MTDTEQKQAFWQMTFDDKVTSCEITFHAWKIAIAACQNARKKLESSPDSIAARLAYDGAEQTKQNCEAGYRESRKELDAWVRRFPFPA